MTCASGVSVCPYNEDYFERGIETGTSLYQNYRWLPELTIPMAMALVDKLEITPNDSILDIGCAKGFLVKAFRLLNREAWGYEPSKYPFSKIDSEVKDFCFSSLDGISFKPPFDIAIAKDVFEHIPEKELTCLLGKIKADFLFAVIPLGKDGLFLVPNNNLDSTHTNCKSMEEWITYFTKQGWNVIETDYRIKGIKESYYEKYPEGHGFFTISTVC